MPLPALPNMAVQDCSPVRTISSKSTSTRTGKRDWWPPVRSPGYPARTSGKNTPRWQQGPAARLFLRPGKVSACGAGCCCGWPGQPDARQVLPPLWPPSTPTFSCSTSWILPWANSSASETGRPAGLGFNLGGPLACCSKRRALLALPVASSQTVSFTTTRFFGIASRAASSLSAF